MSKRIMYLSGQHGTGTPYDLPGYIYDPVNDEFTDMATGNKFDKSGGSVTLVDLTATENKTYTPDSGKAYGKVIVNVPGKTEQTKSESYTTNDTYTITPDEGKVLSSVSVTVNVPDAADLEANKAETIDVSQYTEPVEITPTAGKDGMAKATVTLSNIPSGGDIDTTKWKVYTGDIYSSSETPAVFLVEKTITDTGVYDVYVAEYDVGATGPATLTHIAGETWTVVDDGCQNITASYEDTTTETTYTIRWTYS